MKKLLLASLFLSVSLPLAAQAQVYDAAFAQQVLPFLNQGLPQEFMTASMPQLPQVKVDVNLETPFRCQSSFNKLDAVMTTLPVKESDFTLMPVKKSDSLPRFEVNGYSFQNTPIDEALQTLVDDAGILVYTQDDAHIQLSATDVYGDLETVVQELTKSGDVYFHYDEVGKRLDIYRKARFVLKVPNNRYVMFGVLDALRGVGVKDMTPDWRSGVITMTLSRSESESVKKILKELRTNGEMLLADTSVYALTPKGNSSWSQVLSHFGYDRVFSSVNGLQGQLLITEHQRPSATFLQSLSVAYDVSPMSAGVAVVPTGWKMRFDVHKCAVTPTKQHLSLLLDPVMQPDGRVNTGISVDSSYGELASFNANAAIDDELILIGLPNPVSQTPEMAVIVKLKLIRLIKEGVKL